MVTRRGLLLGTAGTVLLRRAGAGEVGAPGSAGAGDALAVLPGKRPLIQRAFRPPNFETPLADLAAPFTPNDAFFVRYHLPVIPWVDADLWRLQIGGASVKRALTLSLQELRSRFEQVSLAAVNQCAGSRRGLFSPRVAGVQWGNGAMGNASWRGVRLRDVLREAGVAADALEVTFKGADRPVLPATPEFIKSLPVERALDENTLIAFEMNGAPLPHWNGAPARLVVPGWAGTYWVKQLTDVHVEPKPLDNFWVKVAYRLPTGAFPGPRFASQETRETTPVTEILVNSLVTSHSSGATLKRGAHAELAGKAWDGGAGIASVAVSTDGGRGWRDAALGRDLGRFAWREFRFPLDTSSAGPLQLAVRAKSKSGAQQPDKLTFNPSGYHDNIVQTLTLEVA